MGRFDGKVALVTGAGRGQGRSHAVRFASEGADVIALDVGAPIDSVPHPLSLPDDLQETARQVEANGRRVVARLADVRDSGALGDAVDAGVSLLGGLDIVCANAGLFTVGQIDSMSESTWDDVVAVNLSGVWRTIRMTVPHLRSGGSIVIIGSTSSVRGAANSGHYVAAKHGLVGLLKSAALELGARGIRVNMVDPGYVDSPMIHNPMHYELLAPDLPIEERTREALEPRFARANVLPVPWVQAEDVSHAVAWLASDEARYVTGSSIGVDAGSLLT